MQRTQWNHLWDRISIYNIKKGIKYLKKNGVGQFAVKMTERFKKEDVNYAEWFQNSKATAEELTRQRETNFLYAPKISIVVPVYKPPIQFLSEMIESVQNQSYTNWELCLVDADVTSKGSAIHELQESYVRQDKRIKYKILNENAGIAQNTNAAIQMADGDYIGLLDHDDLLAPDALYEVMWAINQNRDTDVLYSDEDKVDAKTKEHFGPNFKSDFNLELLRVNNYICHFFVVKKEIVMGIGGFLEEYNGAQDYDFIFRCIENSKKVCHIPKILYHWRVHKGSTSENPDSKLYAFDAGKRAIEAHLKRNDIKGEISHTKDLGFYKVDYQLSDRPLVSLIICCDLYNPNLSLCVHKIIEETTYENYEIIIAVKANKKSEIEDCIKPLDFTQNPIKVLPCADTCNRSQIMNAAALGAAGEYLLFVDGDTKVVTSKWIEILLGHCQQKNVGIAGGKIYSPDNKIQYAGYVLDGSALATPLFRGMEKKYSGYMHKANLQQNVSAVSSKLMMIKTTLFHEIGQFDKQLESYVKDIDLCLKARQMGLCVVYSPYAETYLIMQEQNKNNIDKKEIDKELENGRMILKKRWEQVLDAPDPYYNINLSPHKGDYSLKSS